MLPFRGRTRQATPAPAAPETLPPLALPARMTPAVEIHHVSWETSSYPWRHTVDCANAADAQTVRDALLALNEKLKPVTWTGLVEDVAS